MAVVEAKGLDYYKVFVQKRDALDYKALKLSRSRVVNAYRTGVKADVGAQVDCVGVQDCHFS